MMSFATRDLAPAFRGSAVRLFAPILIWALHFAAIYGYTAFACSRGLDRLQWLGIGSVAWVVVGAGVAAGLGLLYLMRVLRSRARLRFADWMSGATAALALVGVAFATLSVAWVPPCE